MICYKKYTVIYDRQIVILAFCSSKAHHCIGYCTYRAVILYTRFDFGGISHSQQLPGRQDDALTTVQAQSGLQIVLPIESEDLSMVYKSPLGVITISLWCKRFYTV